MAVPKKRSSRSVRGMRRAHDFLTHSAAVEACPNCEAPKARHNLCTSCGTYRGRLILPVKGPSTE